MYLDFFSLKKFPFRITPDPSMFFPGGANGPGVVLNALVYAVTSGEGIVKVVGEVGSGKTMLCRMLEERLPASIEIVYIANPSLSARDIIYAIAFELELGVDASTDRLMVMHKLQNYLLKKHSEGGAVVVFIEEAQGMPIETLEEIRLLSNLETHRHKLMQIIMFGQPELDKNLQGKNIRQLRERITHSFYLEPMSQEQTSDYLHYRMQAAGCPWPQVFTTKAEKLINKASEGLTRRVNILADKSLMAAYASSSIQPGHQFGAIQQKILPQHVKAAIKDSGYGLRHLLPWTAFFSSMGVVAVALALYYAINTFQPGQELIPEPSAQVFIENTAQASAAVTEVLAEASANAIEEVQINPEIIEASAVFVQEEQTSEQSAEAELALAEVATEDLVSPATGSASISAIEEEVGVIETAEEAEETVFIAQVEEGAATEAERQVEREAEELLEPIQIAEPEVLLAYTNQDSAEEVIVEVVQAEATSVSSIEQAEQIPDSAIDSAIESLDFSELSGLIGVRARASSEWLQDIANKNGYTVQIAAFPIPDQPLLEEYLQLLSLTELLNETYLCLISRTSNRQQQWLVMHGDFNGVSMARDYIESLPTYIRQYEPFARNSSSIACLSDMLEGTQLAF